MGFQFAFLLATFNLWRTAGCSIPVKDAGNPCSWKVWDEAGASLQPPSRLRGWTVPTLSHPQEFQRLNPSIFIQNQPISAPWDLSAPTVQHPRTAQTQPQRGGDWENKVWIGLIYSKWRLVMQVPVLPGPGVMGPFCRLWWGQKTIWSGGSMGTWQG